MSADGIFSSGGAGPGASRRMHGFSVAVSPPVATSADDGEMAAPNSSQKKKRPRETSLPLLGEDAAFDGGTPSREKSSRRSASAGSTRTRVNVPSPGRSSASSGSRSMPAPDRMPADEEDDDQYDQEEYSDEASPSASVSNESSPTAGAAAAVVLKQPSTPLGRVVEPGQEHTGRWTKEEHDAFLVGLQLYGKEWKKVAAKVKTRTVVQTRTHAQKYFQKLQKVMKSSGDERPDDTVTVEMGTVAEAKKASPSSSLRAYQKQKRKGGSASSSKARPPDGSFPALVASPNMKRSSTAEAAAHLVAQMSSSSGPGPSQLSPSSSSPHTPATLGQFAEDLFSAGAARYGRGGPVAGKMKIVAPAHDVASKLGKFPEPSPAACGKRKLAEIAAAQMLAGAMISTGGKSNDNRASSNAKLAKIVGNFSGTSATPPTENGGDLSDIGGSTPPLQISLDGAGVRGAGGAFLQIVNPDSLHDTDDGRTTKRALQGMPSPMTPWDGQLKALVRLVLLASDLIYFPF